MGSGQAKNVSAPLSRLFQAVLQKSHKMEEGVTTLPGSLGVKPYEWTTAHKDIPPDWLHQEGHPCAQNGRIGTMQMVDGKLVCVVNPSKESTKMDTDTVTESVTLRFSSPSRVQLAKAATYFGIGRATGGLGNVVVHPIQGVMGNWYFEITSNEDNQFLDPNKMHGVIPMEVTVTKTMGARTAQTASQDEIRKAILEMVEDRLLDLDEAGTSGNYHHVVNKDSGKVVHSGSKEEARKHMKRLNAEHGSGSHYLAYSLHKKPGDSFRSKTD